MYSQNDIQYRVMGRER